jgi:hypothetical protein
MNPLHATLEEFESSSIRPLWQMDHEALVSHWKFVLSAWELANEKARKLGWID